MGLMGFSSFMSQGSMFHISAQFDEANQSYWLAKVGTEFGN